MKNIRVTLRLSPYQLAHGLQTIRQHEPSYKLISINNLVKDIYQDYLAKISLNKSEEVPLEFVAEIESIKEASKLAKSPTINELINLKQ